MIICEPYRPFQFHHVFKLDNENQAEDMPTLIDRKVRLLKICISSLIFSNIYSWKCIHSWGDKSLILQDNVFIISNSRSKFPVLQLDARLDYADSTCYFSSLQNQGQLRWAILNWVLICRLISDLVVVFVSATCGGIAFACAGQPVRLQHLFAFWYLPLFLIYLYIQP